MRLIRFMALLLMVISASSSLVGQTQSSSRRETRSLLINMDSVGPNSDAALKKLFEEAEARSSDLVSALHDPEQRVNLNAQRVMKYLAEPQMLKAIQEWYDYRAKLRKDYWMPQIGLISEPKYFEDDADLAKLVLENLYPDQLETSAKVVAYNKNLKTALIEVVYGTVFTEGRHVVIRQENGKWRLVSVSLLWQS